MPNSMYSAFSPNLFLGMIIVNLHTFAVQIQSRTKPPDEL